MSRILKTLLVMVVLVLPVLLSACGALTTPVRTSGEAPTPVVRVEPAGTDDPNVFVETQPFKAALLQAIQSRDEALLARLTAERFTSGWWRGEMGGLPQADALRELYQDQLGENIQLKVAPGVDLPLLMGGINPLDILRPEANVIDALVISGWGKDGTDEAILFISRLPDNSLRWAGTLVIKGGFTSPETGGVEPFINAAHGYQMHIPKGYEVHQPNPREIVILAPQGTEGHRERAFISVEPAGGRTVDQITADLKTSALADVAAQPGTVLGLDTEMALVFDRVPSQDLMRMLFVVHEDRLYKMIFIPQDENAGTAYNQMRSLYAVVVNTFQFIPAEDGGIGFFVDQLQRALAQRDKVALDALIGEPFTLAFWASEGVQITSDEAVQQILNNYVPAGAQPVLDPNHAVIARYFAEPVTAPSGEELIPVYVSGWGEQGADEAVLFIARRADGSLYWQGALTAQGGFQQ